MILESLKFLCPTKLFRELDMLVLIKDHPWMSQHALGKEMGITGAMANVYMQALTRKKLVKVEGETNRQKRYFLTPKGKRRRRILLNEYITGVSDLYSTCKKEFEQRLKALYQKGLRRVVFFGAAETGEIALQAAQHTGLEIVSIVDNDPRKHHKKMGGIEVRSPECIDKLHPDGVIITALGHPDEIYQQLLPLKGKGILIKKL
jgi:DNA-binding MarR family transcriptional regulator